MNTTRIENVADWDAISKKYRALVGLEGDDSGSMRDSDGDDRSNATEMPTTTAANLGAANPV